MNMASPLEVFVNNVRQLYVEGSYTDLIDLLKKSSDVLVKNLQHLDNVLETMSVTDHSLAVLAILIAKYSSANQTLEQHEALFNQVIDFVDKCTAAQISHGSELFAGLCHLFTQSLVTRKTPMRGIGVLCQAIDKVQTNPSTLTSIHADLCQLCLLAKCFKPALKYLDSDISTIAEEVSTYLLAICTKDDELFERRTQLACIHSQGTVFDTKYFLLYYYYGGMIYTALKRYDDAIYMFEVVVTAPARAVSHIMLESYKKYILVSLILQGKVPPLPKYASQVVSRFIKPLSCPYQDLAQACGQNNTELARTTIAKHEAVFTRDKNLGLANQVLTGLYRNNIQRLTKTFLTLSLADVAARVSLGSVEEAERHILNMIEDGEIFATVNRKDGMVVFHDDPEKYNSPRMLKILEDQISVCIALDKKIQKMEEQISVSTLFVQKCTSLEDDSTTKACPYSM